MTTSTATTSHVTKTDHRDMTESLVYFDRPPLSTTTSPSTSQREFLLSIEAGFTRPPRNWALVWRLDELEEMPESERWPEADWPSDRAFADARAFINGLPLEPIPLPSLGLADDGEINFLWNQNGTYIDLGFYGTGTFSYFARVMDNEELYDDDLPAADGLPQDLLVLLVR